MTFSNYRDNFEPETLAILEIAFNEAWEVLIGSGGVSIRRPREVPSPS